MNVHDLVNIQYATYQGYAPSEERRLSDRSGHFRARPIALASRDTYARMLREEVENGHKTRAFPAAAAGRYTPVPSVMPPLKPDRGPLYRV